MRVACVTYACPKGRAAIVIYDWHTHALTKGDGHMKNLCKLQEENKGQAKSAGCSPNTNPCAPCASGVHPSVLITVWLPCCASCESLCVPEYPCIRLVFNSVCTSVARICIRIALSACIRLRAQYEIPKEPVHHFRKNFLLKTAYFN